MFSDKNRFSLTFVCIFALLSGITLAAKCPVDPQATSRVSLDVSTNSSNIVRFTLTIPDEKRIADDANNAFTSLEFAYTGCALLDWSPAVLPDISNTAVDIDTAEYLTESWRAYKEISTSPCDSIKLFRELPLADFLTCVTYSTTEYGHLIYTSAEGSTLTRTYTLTKQENGVSTTTTATVEDVFNFQVNLTESYVLTAQVTAAISADPINPDGNVVFKTVSVSAATDNTRVYTVVLLATSLFPFELRTQTVSGADSVSLGSSTNWESGTLSINNRCPGTYDTALETCQQEVTLTLTAKACSFSSELINIPNTILYYGCAAGTALDECPLADDSTGITGTFTSSTPINVTLNTGSTCALASNGFTLGAALSLTLTPANGLINPANKLSNTWDLTQRARYLFKTNEAIYITAEIANVASVSTIAEVTVDSVDATAPSAFATDFSVYYGDAAVCNTTIGTGVGSIFRTCIQILLSDSDFVAPAINSFQSYTFTITMTATLQNGSKKRMVFDASTVQTSGSATVSLQNAESTSTGAGSTGGAAASTSTIAIGAAVGVVGIALIAGIAVLAVVVLKAKAAAAAVAPAAAV